MTGSATPHKGMELTSDGVLNARSLCRVLDIDMPAQHGEAGGFESRPSDGSG